MNSLQMRLVREFDCSQRKVSIVDFCQVYRCLLAGGFWGGMKDALLYRLLKEILKNSTLRKDVENLKKDARLCHVLSNIFP